MRIGGSAGRTECVRIIGSCLNNVRFRFSFFLGRVSHRCFFGSCRPLRLGSLLRNILRGGASLSSGGQHRLAGLGSDLRRGSGGILLVNGLGAG